MRRAVCSAVLALALGVGATDWFDAGISGYTQWPSDGSDFTVAGAGTWSGTANATIYITVKASFHNRLYRCVVTDANGRTEISEAVRLTVQ